MEIRALTVRQPWASLIVLGHKPVENRSWPTRYRGRLLIQAGNRDDPDGYRLADLLGVRLPDELPHGAVIGQVEHVDCVTGHPSLWASPGCWHWVLEQAVVFDEPIPALGRLGLWRPDTVMAQL